MSAPRNAGFTLVEVLVALAVTGIVSLLMLHGVGLAAQGLDRLSRHVEQLDQRRSVEFLMRRALATAVPYSAATGGPAFAGEPARISFLTLVSDGGPGLYRVVLGLETGAVAITRRLASHPGARASQSVLMPRVRRFEIDYFGAAAPAEASAWHRRWTATARLPELVRIIMEADNGIDEPPIVIRLAYAQ